MARTLLIDGANEFLRNYTVVPTLDPNGERIGGVYGFLNSLSYLVKTCYPDCVIIVWDGPGGSKKRRKIYSEYKAGRKPTKPRLNTNFDFEEENAEENKIKQRMRLAEYLKDLPIYEICLADVEADDIIAYLSQYIKDQKIIVSSDKDFFQLLNKETIVFLPTKKMFFTSLDLAKKYSIYPQNFAVARAIVGDSSDNIAGVKGVGLKNVVKYFPFLSEREQVTIESLMQFCEEKVKDKKGAKYQKFIDNRKIIERNFQLMQLKDTVISYSSIDALLETFERSVSYNETMLRKKLAIDSLNLHETFFSTFKSLRMRAKGGVVA